MIERPTWLRDEPEIQALLHAVLDRFDAQSSAERQRDVFIAVEKHVPTLARNDARADQLWMLLGELESLRLCRQKLRKGPMLDAVWTGAKLAFTAPAEAILREWLQRPSRGRVMQSWRDAVSGHAAAFPGGVQALLERRIVIAGRSDSDVLAALARAADLVGPLSLRQLSAHLFWGDSKVLDERGDLIAALFPRLQLRERPIVVAVHLPTMLEGVLFIENQDSYALAVSGAIRDMQQLACVYAAGFRGSASRIRAREGALLHYAAHGSAESRAAFEAWWYEAVAAPALWFWGDLDFAGMQILAALRERFGDVRAWSPGYAPMLTALQSGSAHDNKERGQLDPGVTGCPYADAVLLPAIRTFGCVDQEAFVATA